MNTAMAEPEKSVKLEAKTTNRYDGAYHALKDSIAPSFPHIPRRHRKPKWRAGSHRIAGGIHSGREDI